jgi:hypothetical protein
VKLNKKALGYGIAALLVGFIGYSLFKSWRRIDLSSFNLDVRYLFASLVPHALGMALAALGWGLIVRRLEGGASLLKSAKIYYYTNIPKNLPGTVWYIFGRVYLHEKEGLAKAVTTVAVVLETMLIFLASALVYMVCLIAQPASAVVDWRYILLLFLAGVVLLHPTIFNRAVNYVIRRLGQPGSASVHLRFQDIGLWVALYIIVIAIGGAALFLLVNAVYPASAGTFLPITRAWAISVILSSLVFWLPGHLGIRDGILVVALNSFLPISAALVVALLWRVWMAIDELAWALVATRL